MSWLQLCVVGLEVTKEDLVLEQKQEMHNAIQKATPQELGLLLEAYRILGAGKTVPAMASYILCRGIEHMLAQGYRFVATLPDGRLIVERT